MNKIVSIFPDSLQRLVWIVLGMLILLGSVLRLVALGNIPDGLTWDEVSNGYDGYSVLTTRRDQWLERLPLTFKSFGDYKAPFAIYLTGLSTVLFGLNPLAVRLPFAISGIVALMAWFLLIWQLHQQSRYQSLLALAALLLLVVSPWHIHFSRVGFESGIALTELLLAGGLFLVAVREHTNKKRQAWLMIIAGGLTALSMYTYHSTKIFVPVFLLIMMIWQRAWVLKQWKKMLWFLGSLTLMSLPLGHQLVFGKAAERAEVLIFATDLSLSEQALAVLKHFSHYASPGFLLFGWSDSLRHSTGVMGVLTPLTVALVSIALISFLYQICLRKQQSVLTLLGLVIVVCGVLPAALSTSEAPHPNRSLLALPGFLLLSVSGFSIFWERVVSLQKKSLQRRFSSAVLSAIIAAEVVFAGVFMHYYLTEYNRHNASAFYPGYLEAMALAEEYRRNGTDQIIVSSQYGQPHIYSLFVKKSSPYAFHSGVLVQYLYVDAVQPGDLNRNNTLIVATTEEMPESVVPDHTITDAAGNAMFRLYKTPDTQTE